MKQHIQKAFTLIELLTVIAITAVLMTLIILPIFQSFNLTRAAQAFEEAQSKGRILVERIGREISTSANPRDVSGNLAVTLNGVNTAVPRNSLVVVVPRQDGTMGEVVLPYSKLDLVRPAQGEVETDVNGNPVYRDPVTGKIDPTLRAPKGQVVLPVSPGATLVRYFVGLRDPFTNYNAPYDALLQARNSQRDNLYVLYRAEVTPYRFEPDNANPNVQRAVVNQSFFEVDPGSTDPNDAQFGRPLFDDPKFFVPNRDGGGNIITNDAKADRIRAWLSRAVVQTEVSRYDMIQPIFNRQNRQVVYVGGLPKLVSLVQFRPTRISSDPAKGQVAVRLGEETNNAEVVGPDVFSSQYGLWSNLLVRTWPQGWVATNSALNEYLVGAQGVVQDEFGIFAHDPDQGDESVLGAEEMLFDVSAYEKALASSGRFPFMVGIQSAENKNALRAPAVQPWLPQMRLREIFTPYVINGNKGSILASFGIHEVGDLSRAANDPIYVDHPQNLPYALINPPTARHPNPPYTPMNDPDLAGNFYDAEFSSVNERFNKVWADRPEMRPDVHRFVDLRVTPTADGVDSPLYPDPARGFTKARLVPGSEEVWGPDQLPGPNYGWMIRYTRTTRSPGPNQYRINYVDQPEPSDYALIGFANPPAVYTPTDFTSAIVQPRFKAGYLQLNSDPNVPLPAVMLFRDGAGNVQQTDGQIRVSYRFQFTGRQPKGANGAAKDVFAVDYDSRELMSVLLTIRNYPQSNIPNPQTVTLKATAKVRNFIR